MKNIFVILAVFFFFISCDFQPTSFDQKINEVREDFSKQAEIYNAKTIAWQKLVDSLYGMADTNQTTAFSIIDNLINHDTTLDKHKITELHFIKGDIYYHLDSLLRSVKEFTIAGQAYGMAPKHLAARAGAYIKLKYFSNAFTDLNTAANINYSYLWNLGNFYEIIGKKDSAVSCYTRLYSRDTTAYMYCQERNIELKNPKTKPLIELAYRDRQGAVLLLKGVK